MILLASLRKDVVIHWEKALLGFPTATLQKKFDALKEKTARIKPQILLLDYELPGLNGEKGILELAALNSTTRIIILSPNFSNDEEWGLYKAGAKGCFNENMEPEQIQHAIEIVQQGELWIRRSLTQFMLDELVTITQEKKNIEKAVSELLKNLTRREYEIAMLIGQGENNKQIARQLAITERTVKAHLTEIFRKLNITDRLKLALVVKDTMTLN